MPYAILSVSDKTDLIPFAKGLVEVGYCLLSTGGTSKTLKENNIPVKDISEYTGFPEMMDGRVKTLHPKVHGGVLCLRDNAEHMKMAKDNNIEMIDLVCVNLYPFEKTIANEGCTLEDAIENIDIGGPTMLRSSAKNYKFVTVITDPADYSTVLAELKENKTTSLQTRSALAVKVFARTASYDSAIDMWLSKKILDQNVCRLSYRDGQPLRYGENPHQKSTLYFPENNQHSTKVNVPAGKLLHGKEMSYNNYLDSDASFATARDFYPSHAVSVIKHSNPCGLATGNTIKEALEQAWEGDIVSAFGSVISVTTPFTLEAAEFLKGKFVEVLIAPSFNPDALDFLKNKSKEIRLIETGALTDNNGPLKSYRCIDGALLEQDGDNALFEQFQCLTNLKLGADEKGLYEFAYRSVKHVKSNAINIVYEYKKGQYMVLGMGAGQPNRVDSTRKLAATKARENIIRLFGEDKLSEILAKCVLASDAFFPFPDNIDEAAEIGIKKIIQPGGSKRDEEIIAACNEKQIAMAFTGMRHFYH